MSDPTDNQEHINSEKRLLEIENRFLAIETRANKVFEQYQRRSPRLSDVKWAVSLIALVILGVIGISQWNLNSEKDRFDKNVKEFKTELKNEIAIEKGQREKFEKDLKDLIKNSSDESVLRLYGVNERPLNEQNIDIQEMVECERKERGKSVFGFHYYYILRNESDFPSGPLHVKLYYDDPIGLGSMPSSAHRDKFKYEVNSTPKNPDSLPGRFTTTYVFDVCGFEKQLGPFKRSPAMLQVFYGRGKHEEANIYLNYGGK